MGHKVYLNIGEYKDFRGLKIPDSKIESLLDNVDKDEAEIINFLGDLHKENGVLYYFLESLSSIINWSKTRE